MIMMLLSVAFYINGIETLIALLDSELDTPVRENFQWSVNLIMPITSVILLIIASIFAFFIRPKKAKDEEVVEFKPKTQTQTKAGKKTKGRKTGTKPRAKSKKSGSKPKKRTQED